jgi:CSLREA domain-containing protein
MTHSSPSGSISRTLLRSFFTQTLAVGLVLIVVSVRVVHAATFTVNSTADDIDGSPGDAICATATGECTLRAAIMEANASAGADTIQLAAGLYLLRIAGTGENGAATGDLDVADSLTIIGDGATNTMIDAGRLDRVFDVLAPADVTINGVMIRNGDLGFQGVLGEHGGGIRNGGTLSLNEVVVSDNIAGSVDLPSGIGGGIFNVGTLNLTDVTVSSNSAYQTGGLANFQNGAVTLLNVTLSNNAALTNTAGMDNGEGIPGLTATATLTNVTISGNVGGNSSVSGGGFRNLDSASLTNVTITANTGPLGAGISVPIIGPFSPSLRLKNTIVANNVGRDCFVLGTPLISLGHNMDSDSTCAFTDPTDFVNVEPFLGPLENNGGFTLTHALLNESPAIDAGSPDCPPPVTDQRGVTRPVDGDADGVAVCDIGAFEFSIVSQVLSVSVDIKPGSLPNSVNLTSEGVVPVAILTTDSFDATTVEPLSVQFGPHEATEAHGRGHFDDINGDNRLDLVLHFRTREIGIDCGDTSASLTGATVDGTMIKGADSVFAVRCR